MPPPPNFGISLLNAIYFRGTWKSYFASEHTKNRLFYRSGHMPEIVSMMRQPETRTVHLYRGDQFDAALIPYTNEIGHEWSLQIILPHTNLFGAMTTKEYVTGFLSQVSLNDLDTCQTGYREVFVDLILPHFAMRQTHDLRAPLTQIGVGAALSGGGLQTSPQLLAIQEMRQQISMNVNEEGTEAAALTESILIISPASPVKKERPIIEKFYVNHLFLFLLTENRSGLPLFIGVIRNPLET
ncbi:MAG: hypothetical protein H8F28_19435 [Fibrella sp.]|nr:hypothetical protein [Armatimonadota bacterium]